MSPAIPPSFTYVHIPACTDQPMAELEYGQVDLGNDTFIQSLKERFAAMDSNTNVDQDVLLKQISEHAKCSTDDIKKKLDGLGDGAFQKMMNSTSIDILTLALPVADSGFYGVSLYCDDKGVSKKLLRNARAEGLATACGFPTHLFHGDVFLSMVYDDGEDVWFRAPFTLKDCSSDAVWVKRAHALNTRSGKQPASLSGMANQMVHTPPTLAASTPSTVAKEPLSFGRYTMGQTADDVEVNVPAEGARRADVKVSFARSSLRVEVAGEVVISGDLERPIDVDLSTWTLAGGVLQLTLAKATSGDWAGLIKA